MSVSGLAKFSFAAAVVVWMALQGGRVQAQVQAQEVLPVNSGANPYRVIRNWGMVPEGRPWGAANGVAIDRDGMSVWVADSRRPTAAELKEFPGEKYKGSVVVKFSPQGKVLMTLGKFGVAGNPPEALTDPTNIVTAPNGDIYVAESHTALDAPEAVGRISVFDKSGKFLRSFGKLGTGPGEFRIPHAMVFDSKGRLIVADRVNHRIQILDTNGKFLGEYREFSRVSGLAIDKNDTIYASDSESTAKTHPGWQKGIRIGNLKDGKVTMFVPGHKTETPDGAMGEGIALDAAGNLYTAEATVRGVTKYVKK